MLNVLGEVQVEKTHMLLGIFAFGNLPKQQSMAFVRMLTALAFSETFPHSDLIGN